MLPHAASLKSGPVEIERPLRGAQRAVELPGPVQQLEPRRVGAVARPREFARGVRHHRGVRLFGADVHDRRIVPFRPDLRKRRRAQREGENCDSHTIIRRITESASGQNSAARGADGALEGPAANVVDLLLHGAREGNDLYRGLDEVLPRDRRIGEPRFGDRRDHALFDLGAAPAFGEFRQLVELDAGGVHAAAAEVNLENLQALLVRREIHEEDLVETAFANHFGGQQVDPVGGGGDEQAARLLLHPGEEEREDPALLAAGIGGRDSHLDFVEPQHRGHHVFHHLAGLDKRAFGLPVPAGEDLDHVDAVERQAESTRRWP